MHAPRIIAAVIINDGGCVFVAGQCFTIQSEAAFDMKKILLTVKRTVGAKWDTDDTRF